MGERQRAQRVDLERGKNPALETAESDEQLISLVPST